MTWMATMASTARGVLRLGNVSVQRNRAQLGHVLPSSHRRRGRALLIFASSREDEEADISTSQLSPTIGSLPGRSDGPSPAPDATGSPGPPPPATTAGGQQQQQQQGSPAASQPGLSKTNWWALLKTTVNKLATNLWPLLLVHLVCDVMVFGLHRASHRLTNEAAVKLLGPRVTVEVIGNMWWLSGDPAIANWQTGYQLLTTAVFLLAFPLNILLKTTAAIYTVLICQEDAGAAVQRRWWHTLGALRASLPIARGLWHRVREVWARVFVVELLVAAIVLPLQYASMAVITLPLTLPLILSLQAAGPAAVLEGAAGISAIQRSRQLLKPLRWRLAGPFLGIVAAPRLVDAAKGFLLTQMPPRYYRELVEIPFGILVLGTVASLLLSRLQDVLPFVAYKEAVVAQEQAQQQQEQQKLEQAQPPPPQLRPQQQTREGSVVAAQQEQQKPSPNQ